MFIFASFGQLLFRCDFISLFTGRQNIYFTKCLWCVVCVNLSQFFPNQSSTEADCGLYSLPFASVMSIWWRDVCAKLAKEIWEFRQQAANSNRPARCVYSRCAYRFHNQLSATKDLCLYQEKYMQTAVIGQATITFRTPTRLYYPRCTLLIKAAGGKTRSVFMLSVWNTDRQQ